MSYFAPQIEIEELYTGAAKAALRLRLLAIESSNGDHV
jgi:hypothetical protein